MFSFQLRSGDQASILSRQHWTKRIKLPSNSRFSRVAHREQHFRLPLTSSDNACVMFSGSSDSTVTSFCRRSNGVRARDFQSVHYNRKPREIACSHAVQSRPTQSVVVESAPMLNTLPQISLYRFSLSGVLVLGRRDGLSASEPSSSESSFELPLELLSACPRSICGTILLQGSGSIVTWDE